jgi:hypothetical protein
MIMRTSTFSLRQVAHVALLTFILTGTGAVPALAQISFADDGSSKADSWKVRREASKYKADGVKESHLDMKKYSYKKGEPGKREEGELAFDEIYQAPSPVKADRRLFRKRR